ncbi:hypothetical protein [Hymenobacter sp. BT190]|uniref:hypothetical protein n=1 Tax=Hymenobacter sp. BT190 TaxID=2763505 RepID=UPI00165198FB|nr:hypothetical protein [Hymenobacter sp. BT190]MBC6699140.1 hypothetical protein [Hymenobacter sp. BT190]
MKKRYTLYWFSLLLIVSSFIDSSWVAFSVDDQLQVQLPNTPATKEVNTKEVDFEQHMRMSAVEDNVGRYIIIRDDMTHESDNYLTAVGRKEYYQAAPVGWLAGSEAELLKKSAFSVNGVEGIELAYKVPVAGQKQPATQHVRMLLVGKIAYAFHFEPFNVEGKSNKENRNAFFKSISLKLNTNQRH